MEDQRGSIRARGRGYGNLQLVAGHGQGVFTNNTGRGTTARRSDRTSESRVDAGGGALYAASERVAISEALVAVARSWQLPRPSPTAIPFNIAA